MPSWDSHSGGNRSKRRLLSCGEFPHGCTVATDEDYSFILIALNEFHSAINSPRINATLEKVVSLTKIRIKE